MKKLTLIAALALSSLTANANFDYSSKMITCDIVGHPVYSKTILHGDNEIHFERKDGAEVDAHHDGFLLEYSEEGVSAIYHDGDDLLFYMNHKELNGSVFVPGYDDANDLDMESDDYKIKNCEFSNYFGW